MLCCVEDQATQPNQTNKQSHIGYECYPGNNLAINFERVTQTTKLTDSDKPKKKVTKSVRDRQLVACCSPPNCRVCKNSYLLWNVSFVRWRYLGGQQLMAELIMAIIARTTSHVAVVMFSNSFNDNLAVLFDLWPMN